MQCDVYIRKELYAKFRLPWIGEAYVDNNIRYSQEMSRWFEEDLGSEVVSCNILRYTNSFVSHDAVPAQYMPLLFHGGVPMAFPAPTKSIRFPRLRDSNLSLQNDVIRIRNKVRRGTLPVERRSPISRVIRHLGVSYASLLGVVGLKRTWDQKWSSGLLLTFMSTHFSQFRFAETPRYWCPWQAHGNLDIISSRPCIWQSLVQCTSLPRGVQENVCLLGEMTI